MDQFWYHVQFVKLRLALGQRLSNCLYWCSVQPYHPPWSYVMTDHFHLVPVLPVLPTLEITNIVYDLLLCPVSL